MRSLMMVLLVLWAAFWTFTAVTLAIAGLYWLEFLPLLLLLPALLLIHRIRSTARSDNDA